MTRSRLLIISRCSNPHGGADRIIADLCRNLPSYGWEVTLGLTRGARFNDPQQYRSVYPGLPIIELDGSVGTRASRLSAIESAIQQTSPDVVLSMRVFDAYEVVAKEKSIRDIRLVVGVRAFEDAYLSDVRRYRKLIDGCVTSGKLIAKACSQFALMDPKRVVSIAGGVHLPDKAVLRNPIGDRPVRLLYAGRIEKEQKRCLDLPELLAKLSRMQIDFELDIAGIGPAEQELREGLASFVPHHPIRFHGWVDREKLYSDLYPNADIMVHFAAWEGVTIAPREAMAHGVVPVISRFDGLEDEGQFIDGSNSLVFPVADVNAAAECVQRLIDDAALFARLSEHATESQVGDYSFEGSIAAWDRALRHCLDLPVCVGPLPKIVENLPGRLSKFGIPVGLQSKLRQWTGRRVTHQSPGSEWPTSSGLLTDQETREIDLLRSHQTAALL